MRKPGARLSASEAAEALRKKRRRVIVLGPETDMNKILNLSMLIGWADRFGTDWIGSSLTLFPFQTLNPAICLIS
jgi:hypothetical protein